MKLYLNSTSPYCRLVVAVAIELKIDSLNLVWIDPWASEELDVKRNAFSTIPFLETEEERGLTESTMILQELWKSAQRNNSTSMMLDLDAIGRYQFAFSRTLMESTVRSIVLKRFLQNPGAEPLYDRAGKALERALEQLKHRADLLPLREGGLALPELNLAIALEYLQMRFPEIYDNHVDSSVVEWIGKLADFAAIKLTRPEMLEQSPASIQSLIELQQG